MNYKVNPQIQAKAKTLLEDINREIHLSNIRLDELYANKDYDSISIEQERSTDLHCMKENISSILHLSK